MKLECSLQIFDYSISNLMKILRVGAELFRANMKTDKYDVAKSHFSQFWESARREAA